MFLPDPFDLRHRGLTIVAQAPYTLACNASGSTCAPALDADGRLLAGYTSCANGCNDR